MTARLDLTTIEAKLTGACMYASYIKTDLNSCPNFDGLEDLKDRLHDMLSDLDGAWDKIQEQLNEPDGSGIDAMLALRKGDDR